MSGATQWQENARNTNKSNSTSHASLLRNRQKEFGRKILQVEVQNGGAGLVEDNSLYRNLIPHFVELFLESEKIRRRIYIPKLVFDSTRGPRSARICNLSIPWKQAFQ